jgi:hypothetical protein
MSVIGSAPSDAGQLNQTGSAAGMSALRVGHNCQARDDHQGRKHHVVVALHAVRSPVARERRAARRNYRSRLSSRGRCGPLRAAPSSVSSHDRLHDPQ